MKKFKIAAIISTVLTVLLLCGIFATTLALKNSQSSEKELVEENGKIPSLVIEDPDSLRFLIHAVNYDEALYEAALMSDQVTWPGMSKEDLAAYDGASFLAEVVPRAEKIIIPQDTEELSFQVSGFTFPKGKIHAHYYVQVTNRATGAKIGFTVTSAGTILDHVTLEQQYGKDSLLSEHITPAGYSVQYYQSRSVLNVLHTNDNTYTALYDSPLTWLETCEWIDFAAYMESDPVVSEAEQAAIMKLIEQRNQASVNRFTTPLQILLPFEIALLVPAFSTAIISLILVVRKKAAKKMNFYHTNGSLTRRRK